MIDAGMDDATLDGNAIGGLLAELFGSDMTTAVSTCASCGGQHGGRARVICPGSDRGPLPLVRERTDGVS